MVKSSEATALAKQKTAKNHLLALLALTPFNFAFDRFSQHMGAILKSLQHFIHASECSDFHPQIDGF